MRTLAEASDCIVRETQTNEKEKMERKERRKRRVEWEHTAGEYSRSEVIMFRAHIAEHSCTPFSEANF